jgi:sortase A
MKTIEPLSNPLFPSDEGGKQPDKNHAADLVRQQIDQIYTKEPNAREELAEAETARHRSKHQQFMHQLNSSGKSLADIQTAWHQYYIELPDQEKHQVWQEFYANHSRASQYVRKTAEPTPKATPTHHASTPVTKIEQIAENLNVADIKKQLLGRIQGRGKPKRGTHAQSLAFGLSMGAVVAAIFLFGFFNERFIAPFITPSKQVSTTPIIIDASNAPIGPEPKIIIPKINVEIPVVYDEPSIEEKAVQRALERGVVHYATTPSPGELGNGVIFGHSSNNILNNGKYKFAFVMLKRLEAGDTFMLHKDGKQYVYKVFDKKIVKPEEVSVLGPVPGKAATMTLITCDPPGTSLTRLVVFAEQISPDPSGNVASKATAEQGQPGILPSNAPTLWSRIYAILSR